jgi:Spy/CpxP family protein refolding chaperone
VKSILTTLVILLAATLVAPGTTAGSDCPIERRIMLAQAPPDNPDFPMPGRAERRHLEQLRMLKLLELLDLSEDQELPFLTAFQAMRRQQQQLDTERRDLLEKLADGVKDTSMTTTEIEKAIDRLQHLHDQHASVMRSFITESRSILTTEQMAKMIIFQERFEYELLKKLRGFRDRTGRSGPPTGTGPSRWKDNDNK